MSVLSSDATEGIPTEGASALPVMAQAQQDAGNESHGMGPWPSSP